MMPEARMVGFSRTIPATLTLKDVMVPGHNVRR
jgi:hypothetical protein